MAEEVLKFLEKAGGVISLAAVAVIVAGFSLAAVQYGRRLREISLDRNFRQFQIELARALTLGLEILILADVIETITVTPTFQSLAVLASLVVLRTILSWTLILESEGHWPWQSSAQDGGEKGHA